MAIDGYMAFKPYTGDWLVGESQVVWDKADTAPLTKDPAPNFMTLASASQLFEIEDYSFDVEQTLNIGSQSSGAGAGKITFNPFSITRKIDKASPLFFNMACNGTAFSQVVLALRKSTGGQGSGGIFLRFDFKLVAVKTISWAHNEESPQETINFEYGGLQVRYSQQDPSGKLAAAIPAGWNRVQNVADTSVTAIAMK